MEKVRFKETTSCEIERKSDIIFKGKFKVSIKRAKDGSIDEYEFDNLVTTDGKNTIFNLAFNAATPIATWYIGLLNAAGFTGQSVTDTMASHSGWAEFTLYNETIRQAWVTAAASSGSIGSSTPAQFTINTAGTLQGIFISSNNVKAGTTGFLWTSAQFASGAVPVNIGDVVKITYSVSA